MKDIKVKKYIEVDELVKVLGERRKEINTLSRTIFLNDEVKASYNGQRELINEIIHELENGEEGYE